MPAVSVIVPFYNAASNFERCLRSVFAQTLDDLEFVFVDDGSTDQSVPVLDKIIALYPDRKNSVRLVRHNANQGVLASRKDGVNASTGRYVIFADADDTVLPECYGKLYKRAIETDADMVCCGYVEDVDGVVRDGFFGAVVSSDKERRIRDSIALKSSPFLMTKMVKGDILRSPDFVWPVENIAEDWAMSVQFALLCENVTSVNEKYYRYYIYSGSISHVAQTDTRYISRVSSERMNVESVEKLFRKKGIYEDFVTEFDARKTNIKRLMFPLLSSREMRREWRSTFPEINWRILLNRYVPWDYKIKHLCAMLGIYSPLYSIYNHIVGK